MARLQHLSASELDALVRLGARVTELRRSVPRQPIRAIADAARLDGSFLGELERGRINPSLVVLLRIANALAVPLAELVAPLVHVPEPAAPGDDPSAGTEPD
jgi:transcriptional regulator with XRE-family HTH domain